MKYSLDDIILDLKSFKEELLRLTRLENSLPASLRDAHEVIIKLEKERDTLRDRCFSAGLMSKAPCFACGYNGPNYYKPDIHPCAQKHHDLYGG